VTAQIVRLVPLEITAEHVLNRALEVGLTRVVVIGQTDDGSLFFSSNQNDGAGILWDMEQAKMALFALAKDD
jgi:hypothetical protein